MEKGTARGTITWVGLDGHKDLVQVGRMVGDDRHVETWESAYTAQAVRRLARKLRREAGEGEIRCCYEAGPLGFTLQRMLEDAGEGIVCDVVAPSLIPVKPGDRIKTDRRDARKLVQMLRAGVLTAVMAPTPAEEAVRDLCRCREDAKEDLLRSRHRLGKFLLRRGLIWREGRAWTKKHRSWILGLSFEEVADRGIFAAYVRALDQAEERVKDLDRALEAAGQQEPYRTPVGWLRCYRGIDTVTALTVVAELHGVGRFQTARQLMGYLGLTPSVHASGGREHRGGITKTRNAHVRRVLIEAAWSFRHPPSVGPALRRRREGQPGWVIVQADRAMRRLHRRYERMLHHNKPVGKVVVAIARELVGFLWATLHGRECSTATA